MSEEEFLVSIEGYLRGTLSPGDRKALAERIRRDPRSMAVFESQVRLSLELQSHLRPDDAEDARRRASLILSGDSETRSRRVLRSIRQQLGMRPPAVRRFMIWGLVAAGGLLAASAVFVAFWASRPRRLPSGEETVREAPRPPEPKRESPEKEVEAAKAREDAVRAAGELRNARDRRLEIERDPEAVREKERLRAEEESARLEAARKAEAERRRAGEEAVRPEEPPPTSAPTVAAVARLEDLSGEVFVLTSGGRVAAKAGQGTLPDQGIETSGPLSWAVVTFPDSTRLELWENTRVLGLSDVPPPAAGQAQAGKRCTVAGGTLLAKVVRQPKGQPMVFATPQGEARILETSLRLEVEPDPRGSTRLEVSEGRAQLRRSSDGRVVDIQAGHYAVAGPGMELWARPLAQGDAKEAWPPAAGVDQARVDEAIRKGVEFLKKAIAWGRLKDLAGKARMDELVLMTFAHAGVPENDPDFQALFKTMTETELQCTYDVSLQAVILEEMHRVKYQGRIAQCAQFLVDNQARDGRWSYGTPSPFAREIPGGDVRPEISSGPGSRIYSSRLPPPPGKPRVVRKIAVRKRREGPGGGDPSNSQYAMLGLRACHDAGIVFPVEAIRLAEKSWRAGQEADKGWRYGGDPASTGSMTAGAAGSLIICRYILNEPWMNDEAVVSGLDWLARHFTVTQNPGRKELAAGGTGTGWMYYYYLYALERLGAFYPTETIGAHRWYPEGVRALLAAQEPGGMWQCVGAGTNQVWDTCFAILFLRRATRPLIDVETVDRFKKK